MMLQNQFNEKLFVNIIPQIKFKNIFNLSVHLEKIIHLPIFLTATIKGWKPLLKPDKYKIILLNKLKQFVDENKIILHAYCLMHNHIHKEFLESVSKKIKKDLEKNHPHVLKLFASTQKDRTYHFWKRRPLAIDLYTPAVFEQKIDYIYNNPVTAGLCELPKQYTFSSARFYFDGIDDWKMLTHYNL
jgi:putative transposase